MQFNFYCELRESELSLLVFANRELDLIKEGADRSFAPLIHRYYKFGWELAELPSENFNKIEGYIKDVLNRVNISKIFVPKRIFLVEDFWYPNIVREIIPGEQIQRYWEDPRVTLGIQLSRRR